MKTHIRNHLAALLILLPTTVTLLAAPSAALAQPARPELRSVEITSDGDLVAGTRLRIRAEGTPRGQAMLRIRGVRDNIALREMRPGVYVGRYTIKRSDRISDESPVRATLRAEGRTAVASYSVGEAMSGPPVASAPRLPHVRPDIQPAADETDASADSLRLARFRPGAGSGDWLQSGAPLIGLRRAGLGARGRCCGLSRRLRLDFRRRVEKLPLGLRPMFLLETIRAPAGLPDFRELVLDVYASLDTGIHAVLAGLPVGVCNCNQWQVDCTGLTERQTAEVKRFIVGDYDVVLGMLERRLDDRTRGDSQVRREVAVRLRSGAKNPAPIHRALMRLAERGGARTIVTTNFDLNRPGNRGGSNS